MLAQIGLARDDINCVAFPTIDAKYGSHVIGGHFEFTKLQDLLTKPNEVDRIGAELENFAKTAYSTTTDHQPLIADG